MPTIGTSYQCRRGTSTILGTLIFVGIIFTAVIPMMLVVKQADTLHEMRKHQLEIMDEEKEREYLRVRISPVQGSSTMNLKVENKGDLVAKIIRIWINEKDEDMNFLLNPNEAYPEETLTVSAADSYSVIVVTEKGNLFASDNSLTYDGGSIWTQEDIIYAIYVRIASAGVIFHIEVTDRLPEGFYELAIVQKVGGGTAFKAFVVPEPVEPVTYYIKITSQGNTLYDDSVTLTEDDKSVWVDA